MKKKTQVAPCKVKVLKCSLPSSWYSFMEELEFDVINSGDGKNFYLFDDYFNDNVLRCLLIEDCTVIYGDPNICVEPVVEKVKKEKKEKSVEEVKEKPKEEKPVEKSPEQKVEEAVQEAKSVENTEPVVENFAILRNIKTDDLYEAHGNDKYTNIRTGATGVIAPDLAKKLFAINLEATGLIGRYPLIKDFISKLQLKVDAVKYFQ
jgi:hypothetical protein